LRPFAASGGGALVALLAAAALTGGFAPEAGAALVARWTFDEGSGGTAADGVGGHDGTLTPAANPPLWTTVTAPTAYANPYALSFDDVNDHVVATGYKAITGDMPRSVAAWINTGSTGNEAIVSWGTDSPEQKWIFRVQDNNGTVGAIRVEVNGGYVVGSTVVGDGGWHHVAAVLPNMTNPNVTDVQLYVDGVPETPSTSQSKAISTARGSDVRIGQDHSNRYFDGLIDDVQIYNHALSLAEVQALAAGQAPPEPSPFARAVLDSDPIAYWRLDDVGPWAPSLGRIGDRIYSEYNGGYTQGVPSLLPLDADPAARFDGSSGRVFIPDQAAINDGGPYVERTIELFFQADDTSPRQVLYEEGGRTRGLNIYLEDGVLYVGAWNDSDDDGGQTSPWGPFFLSTPVQADEPYMVDLVLAGDPTGKTGSLIGYLNGVAFDDTDGVGRLFGHAADCAIAAMKDESYFATGGVTGDDYWFAGVIDEVSLYDRALSADEITHHYYAAAVPEPATLTLLATGLLGVLRRRRRR
jgi:hypothetical protein